MAHPIAPQYRADRFRTSTHADLPQTKYDVNDPLSHRRQQRLARFLQSKRFGYSTSPALDNLLVIEAVAHILGAMTAPPAAVAALADVPPGQTLLVVNADMMDIISKLAPVIYAKLVPLLVIINTDNKKWTVVNAVELYAVCKGAVPGVNPHSVPQEGALLGMMDGGCMNGDGGFSWSSPKRIDRLCHHVLCRIATKRVDTLAALRAQPARAIFKICKAVVDATRAKKAVADEAAAHALRRSGHFKARSNESFSHMNGNAPCEDGSVNPMTCNPTTGEIWNIDLGSAVGSTVRAPVVMKSSSHEAAEPRTS
jgi:hypothetical protein